MGERFVTRLPPFTPSESISLEPSDAVTRTREAVVKKLEKAPIRSSASVAFFDRWALDLVDDHIREAVETKDFKYATDEIVRRNKIEQLKNARLKIEDYATAYSSWDKLFKDVKKRELEREGEYIFDWAANHVYTQRVASGELQLYHHLR